MSRHIGEQIQHVKQVVEQLNIRQSNDSPPDTVTREYGFIKFTEDDLAYTTRLSQYIRLALQTNVETVVQFVKDAWNLRTPDLIISITGGAKYCDLSARLKKSFQVGLVSAAATTNAWIITAGTDAGVVKEVGDALNKYRYKSQKDGVDIPCIGIGSWGYTAGKHQLNRSISSTIIQNHRKLREEETSLRPFRFNIDIDAVNMDGDAASGIQTYVAKQIEEKRCYLEPNHTHFLLFDDGSPKADSVLPLRAELEKNLRCINTEQTIEGAVHTLIPIVMVLLEGGPASIKTICEALESNTPVVVIKGSGRAADLVADLHAYCSENLIDSVIKDDDPVHSQEINAIFAKTRTHNAWVDTVKDSLCRILPEHRGLVMIFDFDNEGGHVKLEDAILEVVFNAAKFHQKSDAHRRSAAELKLALAWHNIEYAREAIFTDSSISTWRNEDLRQGLVNALSRGHIDFIELFIEYGTTLEKLTMKDLEYLYSTASIDKVLPLKKIKHNAPTRDEFYTYYFRQYLEVCDNKNEPMGDNAMREIFFWAIFLDRFDLAVYLCSKTWNQSAALLFGARIYQKAAIMTIDSETKQEYEENANKFDQYAASIIDRCFDNDRDFAINIVNQCAVSFHNVLPLQLALKADCQAFLASKCVQKHLDNEWFGNINYKRQNINFRIFMCSLFFPLFPLLCCTLPYIHRRMSFDPNVILRNKIFNSTVSPPNTNKVRWSEKIIYFYKAPIVRFYYNLIFFCIFLGLFSFVILVDYFPLNIHHGRRSGIQDLPIPITEICLHACIWGIIFEEFRQFFQIHSYMEYLSEVSNLIDLTAIILYIMGFITRFVVTEEFFTFSKIMLGLDLILWYVRILHLFAAYERLGPKLIMIFNTMKDLLFFVCFILIFLFAFSITSWSLLITPSQVKWNYDEQGNLINVTIAEDTTNPWDWKLLRDITHYGVWKVFGQVDLIEGNNSYSAVAFVLAILFVAISNVLLLNVLVALFNVTIEHVHDRSHNIWRYQRFLLVTEFRKKSLLPPPFNGLYCLASGIVRFISRHRKRYRHHTPVLNDKLMVDVLESIAHATEQHYKVTDLMKRESAIAEDVWRDVLKQIEEKDK